jgi:hypothetical protein
MNMLLLCPRVQAVFVSEGVRLAGPQPAQMLLDEHGGTYVLKVGELEVTEITGTAEESGLLMEIALSPPQTLVKEIEEFAAQHRLPLAAETPAPAPLAEQALLAACHIPQRNLFVFGEEPQLTVRNTAGATVELTVPGPFKSRRLVSREADMVIHLNPAAITRLLGYLLTLARENL